MIEDKLLSMSGAVEQLDLTELCIKSPRCNYFVRASGDSMTGSGIFTNDIIVVDRSFEPRSGDIIVAALNGEFILKVLELEPTLRLIPTNTEYPPIVIGGEDEFELFGVATFSVQLLRK